MRDLLPTMSILATGLWRRLRGALVACVHAAGVLLVILVALAFTRVPFDAHRWLGTAAGECSEPPSLIVVLGGSGMPSGPELLRMHKAAGLSRAWPQAAIAIVHPGDDPVIMAMRDELLLRGVDSARITLYAVGENTREQAIALARLVPSVEQPVAVVTAPENTYRSVLAFRTAGFTAACGAPAWDHATAHLFDYEHEAIGGKPWLPDVSGRPALRYTFWNYLKLEVACLREYAAIAYYWLNDWI